jgi:hypothetical protein
VAGRSYRLSVAYSSPPTNGSTLVSLIGSSTNIFSVTTSLGAWATFSTEFVADQANMLLQFAPAGPASGINLDMVMLEDTGTIFLNPEEPLSVLQGERAMGEWKLEAIDNRTGATVPAAIDEWELILDTAAPARLAEPFQTGQTYPTKTNNPAIIANPDVYTPGTIIGGETEWFYYDVCSDATKVSIQLAAPDANTIPMQLLVDRSGFPTGDPERDDYAILTANPSNTVTLKLTLDSPAAAPLQPGKRLFFAVRAATFPPTTTETFTINVQSDGTCPFVAPIILTPGKKISSMAFASSAGDSSTEYQATTSAASSVEISADKTLTLLASNGTDPTETNYQLKQTVSSGSATLALPSAGTWFLRVVNSSATTVPYTIELAAQSNIRDVSIASGQLQVTWASVAGTSYEIATSTDLVNWTPVTTVQATGDETTYTDTASVTGTARFIRIRPQ